jgi:hypothetical protein
MEIAIQKPVFKPVSLFKSDYKLPAGDILNMPKGGSSIKFVIIDTIVTGWSYWTADKKCIRSRVQFTSTPGIKQREDGTMEKPKHFWFCKVWDCDEEAVRFLEITQGKTINRLADMLKSDDYDFTGCMNAIRIGASGSGMTTEYTERVVPMTSSDHIAKFLAHPNFSKDTEKMCFETSVEGVANAPVPAAGLPVDKM